MRARHAGRSLHQALTQWRRPSRRCFDGTVTAIGAGHADPRNAVVQLVPMTFRVHHWFKGGGPVDTVTIDIPVGFPGEPRWAVATHAVV